MTHTTGQGLAEGRGVQALRAHGLGKEFRRDGSRVAALEGLDLIVETGSFVTVIGPSGCGKTSLLRIVGGLEEPTAGDT